MQLDPEATTANRALLVSSDLKFLNEESKKIIQEYNRKFYQRFQVYSEWNSHPSDRWVYGFTKIIENVFSIATGGYFLIVGVASFLVIIVNILWSLIFTISQVNASFGIVNYLNLFGLLTFVASFFYYDIFNYNKETSFNTLKLYHKACLDIRWIKDSYEIGFDYLMREYCFQEDCQIDLKELGVTKKALAIWFNENVKNVEMMFKLLIILNLYALRIYILNDFHNDYEDFSVSRRELIEFLLKFQKTKKIPHHYSADDIMYYVLKEIQKIIQFFPITSRLSGKITFNMHNMAEMMNQINILKTNLAESSTARHVPLPSFYVITRNGFVFFWMFFIIPFIAYFSASTLLFLFGSIVMVALLIPLVNVWFISKPFIYVSHYAGPNYFKWRKKGYREIYNTFSIIESQLESLRNKIIALR